MSVDMVNREDGDWVRGFLAREVVHEPGTHFLYNNGSTYTLSRIIKKVTGLSALDYLRPRLLDPLGIVEAVWPTCPKGASIGASQLHVTTEAILRFGQFYLDRGVWNGERLLNENWFDLATTKQVNNGDDPNSDWAQGYGFQFWRCRHNCYRGDGAFGQYCIVINELDMVIAITASVSDMQTVMTLAWEHLLIKAGKTALPENPEALDALKAKLDSLQLPAPNGKSFSPTVPSVSGHLVKRSEGEGEIQSCIFDFDAGGCTLTMRDGAGDRSIRAGATEWAWGTLSLEGPGQRIAAIGSWTAEDTYEIKVRYTNSPSGLTVVSKFEDGKVDLNITKTARFSGPEGPTFTGVVSR
jgi:hypothetical protein